ncbi:MAG TPA: redoxin domain-containing protein [Chitinophagaceae bacterium]|nr:redoxin domain-containing protein [Chitinophagaceae bacterium]
MKIYILQRFAAITACMFLSLSSIAQATARDKTLDSLKKAIETSSGDLAALQQYINVLGYKNDTVAHQFDIWIKQFPRSANFVYALGEAYYKAKDRQCINYLVKAWDAGDTTLRVRQMVNVAVDNAWQLDIPRTPNTIDSLRKVIVANTGSLLPLQQYLFLMGNNNDTAIAQLNEWITRYPKSVIFPYALGENYYNAESPKAKPYLLKVVALQPNNAEVYLMLSIDAERWGDNAGARAYMGKAATADTANPAYAFYYADSFRDIDTAEWHKKTWELVKRFPASERGAQGLYWLAQRSHSNKEKIAIGEQLKKLYPPDKFNWSASGMSNLFDVYIQEGMTDKAIALAEAMGDNDDFGQKLLLAKSIVAISALASEKKFDEALAKTAQLKTSRYSGAANTVALFKARILDAAGFTAKAYDSLVLVQAKNPDDAIYAVIANYGSKLGKSNTQIEKDIWAIRNQFTKPAPAFSLGTYTSAAKARLEDYKGKVVLLTFWFPGCGPCRGEMPHFENVLRKYTMSDIAYLGINVLPEQDEYVLPFMKGTKYSFTPLRGTEQWAKDVYKVHGEPTNFLIDRQGQVVYSNFTIDGNNEHLLELMINSLVDKKG